MGKSWFGGNWKEKPEKGKIQKTNDRIGNARRMQTCEFMKCSFPLFGHTLDQKKF